MIIISHRGNIDGPNPNKENHPDYILSAISKQFDVEVDIWMINNKFYLGHDHPQYEVAKDFILNKNFWHHAKNIQAFYHLSIMRPYHLINCFFHNTDAAVLTSGGWLWTYPGKELTPRSIAVLPEIVPDWNTSIAAGICTDYPIKYNT